MRIYKLLSVLLLYPQQELLDALPQIHVELAGVDRTSGAHYATLTPLLNYLHHHATEHGLIELQENYVQTFDRTSAHSLHLFEHIHGESRDRGQAMVDLLHEYRQHGWQMTGNDLPDYVPLFLEFLSTLNERALCARLLGDAIHVLAHVGNSLRKNGSPYACLFSVLQSLSPVAAEPLSEPPIRDMDEALETFGPSVEGIEPLLNPLMNAQCSSSSGGSANIGSSNVSPINFYPKAAPAPVRTARSA